MRADFPQEVKENLAKRVGMLCSDPQCRRLTSGPKEDSERALNVGVAAHITAASEGGPRYDSSLTHDQRKSIDNGVWLCKFHATMIDEDPRGYPVPMLRLWKKLAEEHAHMMINNPTPNISHTAIAIVGAGSYGTALCRVLAENGHDDIRLYSAETDVLEQIGLYKMNERYLSGVSLSLDHIHTMQNLREAVTGAQYVLLTVPSPFMRETMKAIKPHLMPHAIIILTSKGMVEKGTMMSQLADQELRGFRHCGFYGITFAKFIAHGAGLSSVCIAAPEPGVAEDVAK